MIFNVQRAWACRRLRRVASASSAFFVSAVFIVGCESSTPSKLEWLTPDTPYLLLRLRHPRHGDGGSVEAWEVRPSDLVTFRRVRDNGFVPLAASAGAKVVLLMRVDEAGSTMGTQAYIYCSAADCLHRFEGKCEGVRDVTIPHHATSCAEVGLAAPTIHTLRKFGDRTYTLVSGPDLGQGGVVAYDGGDCLLVWDSCRGQPGAILSNSASNVRLTDDGRVAIFLSGDISHVVGHRSMRIVDTRSGTLLAACSFNPKAGTRHFFQWARCTTDDLEHGLQRARQLADQGAVRPPCPGN